MALGEFELIARYFQRPENNSGSHLALGIGDDCALLRTRPGTELAISCDMLVQGQHFFADVAADSLGHKALAVNLSDLAACGARPIGFNLALALPAADPGWLSGFSRGLFELADAHHCPLIGGDTTRGPLTICITVFGEVPSGQALLRSGAKSGDLIWVSGSLGDARLALFALQGRLDHLTSLTPGALSAARQRLEWPSPRVALGLALRGVASAAIDISDGLMGDLNHILNASSTGATLEAQAIKALMRCTEITGQERLHHVLTGGDDYELLFTAPASASHLVASAASQTGTPVTCIGRIDATPGLRLLDAAGQPIHGNFASFDHFA